MLEFCVEIYEPVVSDRLVGQLVNLGLVLFCSLPVHPSAAFDSDQQIQVEQSPDFLDVFNDTFSILQMCVSRVQHVQYLNVTWVYLILLLDLREDLALLGRTFRGLVVRIVNVVGEESFIPTQLWCSDQSVPHRQQQEERPAAQTDGY